MVVCVTKQTALKMKSFPPSYADSSWLFKSQHHHNPRCYLAFILNWLDSNRIGGCHSKVYRLIWTLRSKRWLKKKKLILREIFATYPLHSTGTRKCRCWAASTFDKRVFCRRTSRPLHHSNYLNPFMFLCFYIFDLILFPYFRD